MTGYATYVWQKKALFYILCMYIWL